jgi:septum formation protein
MMTLLAGRSHEVHTGLALYDSSTGLMDRIASLSRVHFAPMDEAELASYLASGDWRGVAGAYRVQGRAALHIERIEGSWSGIVGLPLRELYVILARSKFGLYGAKPV